jgi:hypothetical protein
MSLGKECKREFRYRFLDPSFGLFFQTLYQITDYPVTDEGFPDFLIQKKHFVVAVNMTGKIKGIRNTVYLFSIKVNCEFRK